MDSFYTFLINGLFMYANRMVTFQDFLNNYCFEVSLFTGKKSPINLKYVIKMSNYILKCQGILKLRTTFRVLPMVGH